MATLSYPLLTLSNNATQVYEINKKGDLQNAYSPLQNLMTSNDLGDFTTSGLNFDPNNPVDIIVTDEYDGSQNLIINDDVNEPKLVNSRMSVQENHTFLIPEHFGNCVTNVYDNNTLDKDTSLLKLYDTIPELTYNGLLEGGALQCGSYTFYFKLADADGNLTNTIQESGIVTVHIGEVNTSKVRMGMQDEVTDKRVSFTLSNLDSGFDYVRVFFERSSSSNDGVITPLFYMIDLNYPIVGNKAQIVITGEELMIGISKSDIQNEFADISAAKTLTILQNILFMGNTLSTDYDYAKLQQLAWKIIPKEITEEMMVGAVTGNYDLLSTNGSAPGIYYNTKNQYYYTGYWPDEYYRFGVVFIFNNNMTSPVFNILGVNFDEGPFNDDAVFFPDYDVNAHCATEIYESEPTDYVFKKEYMTNSKGVIKFSKKQVIDGVSDAFMPQIHGIEFDLTHIGDMEGTPIISGTISTNTNLQWEDTLKKYKIKGLFFVRQKRIPSILAQGMVIGLTDKEHGSLPVIQNKNGSWCTYSFLDKYRLLNPKGTEITIPGDCVKTKALLVPDFELNTATYNLIFTSESYTLDKIGSVQFTLADDSIIPKSYSYETKDDRTIAKVTAVPQESLTKTDGENYFSTMAGTPEEPYKTEDVRHIWDKTPPLDLTVSTSLVRGKWGAYVGISSNHFEYGDIVNIKDDLEITNPDYTYLLFLKRFTDNSFYSAITHRYNYDERQSYKCFRGDCFPSMFTHRMMSNFKDPELPTNHKIVDGGCWAKNYAVRCTAELLATTHSNLTDDSAGWCIPSPKDKKSNIVSLVFGILTGNIGTVINAAKDMSAKRPVQNQFNNELAQAFEIYTGVDGKSDSTGTYNSALYTNINGLELTVAAGYIKKVNPKELEASSSGLNLKAMFKSDDKWELHGLALINRADVNAVSFGQWITFPICSSLNLAFRDVDFSQATEEASFNKKRSFYPLEEKDITNPLNESLVANGACKKSIAKVQTPVYRATPFIKQEFFNRIYWSKPNITDNVINSYRMIFKNQYREYNKEFGSITKLESLGENLVIVFQHGIGIVPVDRSIRSEADATPYLASKNVLPAQIAQIVTHDYGSMWKDSIIKVPDMQVIFGVDTVARKIWMLSTEGLKFISDQYVTKFLNDFVDLSEYDFKEYQGHINVKTHYNAFKKDVIFTYYKDIPERDDEGKIVKWKAGTTWSLCYNLVTQTFVTFYDWYPVESCNVDNIYFSFDKELIDSVLDKKADHVKIVTCQLWDDAMGEVPYTLESKALVDPQFFEKCKVYHITPGVVYTVKAGALTPQDYICYYELINDLWLFKFQQKSYLITASGTKIADLKIVQLNTGISTQELEKGPLWCYNLRNSTPNRMLLWKHGLAGLYDNQGKIKPTHWYGNLHEFNFEFVVNDLPQQLKIFNNLKIISNKTEPDKFEYEIVGEGYEWFEFKPIVEWINKKHLEDPSISLDDWYKIVLGNDSNTLLRSYPDFPSLFDGGRIIRKLPYLTLKHTDKKGTPERPHYTWNNPPGTNYWAGLSPNINEDKYSYNCSEPCFVEDDLLNETRIRTEQLGNDMKKYGRVRGNMQYLEDLWDIEIRPVRIKWCYKDSNNDLKIISVPETRHRDKYIKIKVRYSGEDLALIQTIITLFNESYA